MMRPFATSTSSSSSSSPTYFSLILSFFTGTIITLLFVSLGFTPLIPKETHTGTTLTSISSDQSSSTSSVYSSKGDDTSSSSFSPPLLSSSNHGVKSSTSFSTVSSSSSSFISSSINHRSTSSASSADSVDHRSFRGGNDLVEDNPMDTSSSVTTKSKSRHESPTKNHHRKSKGVVNDEDDGDEDDDDDRGQLSRNKEQSCLPIVQECDCATKDSLLSSPSLSTTTTSSTSSSSSTIVQSLSATVPEEWQTISMEVHLPGWIFTNPYTTGPLPHTGNSDNFAQYRKSQGEEDIFALTQFFWKKEGGIILESGAWDGIGFSTSYLFYHVLGWKSVHIEPAPANYKMLIKNRPDALNIHTALCERHQTVHWIEHSDLNDQEKAHLGAIDGIAEFMAPKFRDQFWPGLDLDDLSAYPTIPCRPLVPLLLHYGLHHIDFWVLDVEGAELQVLKAVNFKAITIDVIVIEADGFAPEKDANVIAYLKDNGYRYMGHNARNDWFVRDGFVPSKRSS